MSRRLLWPAVVAVAVVAVAFLLAYPTRTYLAQRHELASTTRQLAAASAHNDQMNAEVTRLNTDSEIERLAREQYGLVKPGEEAYAILPAPAATPPATEARAAAPVNPPPARRGGWWRRVARDLSPWG